MVKKIVVLILFCSITLLGQKNNEEMIKTKFRAFKNYENNSYQIPFDLTSFNMLKTNQLKKFTHTFFKKKSYEENINLSCFYFKVAVDNNRQRNITNKRILEYFTTLPSKCFEKNERNDKAKSFADSFDIYGLGYYYDKQTGLSLLFIRISNNLKNEFGRVDEHPIIKMLVIKNNVLTSWVTLANEDLDGFSYSKYLDDLCFKHFSQYVPYDDLGTPEMEKEAQKLRYSLFKIDVNGHVVANFQTCCSKTKNNKRY